MRHESPAVRAAFLVYELLWAVFTPLLRFNHRLKEGFRQRRGLAALPQSALWIQAASVGEAYLAREILKRIAPGIFPLSVLLTSNTRQGLDIHRQTIQMPFISPDRIRSAAAYFPFDRPTVMRNIVRRVRPAVVVLLETEIWPGLLRELRRADSCVLVINGRISHQSLNRYRIWPSLWRTLAPHRILAVSEEDAVRFRRLFGKSRIAVIPNIKFDRFDLPEINPAGETTGNNDRSDDPDAFPAELHPPMVILGSVRREEEAAVAAIVTRIRSAHSLAVIALFPRHLHRIDAWCGRLDRMGVPWVLRSRMDADTHRMLFQKTVVIWDTIGELSGAYGRAQAAFVGGSLAPLGGQNFIEPLMCGLRPVIGPSWKDFKWVGAALFDHGLVKVGRDWRAVADLLIRDLSQPPDRRQVQSAARAYFSRRKGGADEACRLISSCLNRRRPLFSKVF